MTRPVLFDYYRSSASYRVRIALNLKSLPYVYHGVDLMHAGGDQWKQPYRDVNPQSRVRDCGFTRRTPGAWAGPQEDRDRHPDPQAATPRRAAA